MDADIVAMYPSILKEVHELNLEIMIGKRVSISNLRTMADNTVRIAVDFPELTSEEVAQIYGLKSQGEVGVIIAETEMLEELIELLKQIRKE